VQDFEQAFNASQFDSEKHLRHSRGWGKSSIALRQAENASPLDSAYFLNTMNLCMESNKCCSQI
jgi:hypothetical protein